MFHFHDISGKIAPGSLGALIILLTGSSIRGIAACRSLSSDPVCHNRQAASAEGRQNRKEVFAMAKVRVTVKVAVKTTVKRREIVRK